MPFAFFWRYHNPCGGSKPARISVAKKPNVGRAEFLALDVYGLNSGRAGTLAFTLDHCLVRVRVELQ
jgi:hypothetical protein